MLNQTLNSINQTLNSLIQITLKDIEDIKQAKHNSLFERNQQKEELIKQFSSLKSQIDSILVQRSQSGKPLEELLSKEEDILLSEFKENLTQFHKIHNKFSKMALIVTNFYNNLMYKINGEKVDIGYKMNKTNYSSFSLKG